MIAPPIGRSGCPVDLAYLWVVAGALAAGFVTGLAGFGVGLTSLGFWLHVMEPVVAGPLVAICSVAGQVRSIVHVRKDISLLRVLPLVVGGVIGLPAGVYLLNHVEGQDLKVGLGAFLIAYSIFGLAVKLGPVFAKASALSDGAVGIGGGILGGIAGLSGPLATIWCGLRGWNKDQQRATYQSYNLIILALAVAAYASQGLLTREVGLLTLISVPALLVGVQLGLTAYKRVNESGFRKLVLILLLASGVSLVVNNALSAGWERIL